MRAHPGRKPPWRRGTGIAGILSQVRTKLQFHPREIGKLSCHGRVHEDPREVMVPAAEAEPATHLKQRVVSICRPREDTDAQTLQGESSRQPVATNNYVALRPLPVLQHIIRTKIQDL